MPEDKQVRFDVDNQYNSYYNEASEPKLVRWLVDKQVAKNAKQAKTILITASVLVLFFAVILFVKFGRPDYTTLPVPPDQIVPE